jgi:hypothetical protein
VERRVAPAHGHVEARVGLHSAAAETEAVRAGKKTERLLPEHMQGVAPQHLVPAMRGILEQVDDLAVGDVSDAHLFVAEEAIAVARQLLLGPRVP